MNKKIMVVDDQEDMLRLIKAILSKNGFEVSTDPTGSLLDNIDPRQTPDLIILDINLKDRNGDDICRELKQDPKTKNIPVILISALMDVRKISRDCGAEDYIFKPFKSVDLINKVRMQLQAA
jgi:DNA-binding response OmpR family regulator